MEELAAKLADPAQRWPTLLAQLRRTRAVPLAEMPPPCADAQLAPVRARYPVGGSLFEFLQKPPLQLYLQDSRSALLSAHDVATPMRPGFRVVTTTPMGVSLQIELPHPELGGYSRQLVAADGRRLCHGVAWLSLHLGHSRYAAMRQAALLDTPAKLQGQYAKFHPRLMAAAEGELTEARVAQLVDEIVDHALYLAGCERVEIDPRVHAAMQLRDTRPVLRVSDIAGELGLSASRLSHLFSEHTGFSFRQYLLLARTLLAWDEVAFSPELSLTEIAHKLDFADLAHMSRAFQLVFSYPPSFARDKRRWCIHGHPAEAGDRIAPHWKAT